MPGRHVARTLPPLAGLEVCLWLSLAFCLCRRAARDDPGLTSLILCADEQRMRFCSLIASTALLTSANCLSAPRRRRQPVSRGGPEPATRAIRKNLARALAAPVAFKAASRFEPVRKLMAFDRVRVGLVAGTVQRGDSGRLLLHLLLLRHGRLESAGSGERHRDVSNSISVVRPVDSTQATMNSINVVIVNPKFIAAFNDAARLLLARG